VRDSGRTIRIQEEGHDGGYAMVSVLFLVTILSILSALILNVQMFRHEAASKSVNDVKAIYAANNGIENILALPTPPEFGDSTFTSDFPDSSSATVTVFQWGLFEGAVSKGRSNHCTQTRSALVAGFLSVNDSSAFVLGNLEHGLVLAGGSEIVGNVVVGPRGVSTGSLRDEITPSKIPVQGKIRETTVSTSLFGTPLIDREVSLTKAFLSGRRPTRMAQDYSGKTLDTTGYVRLNDISDSIREIFSAGDLSLGGTIMKRGPPLDIVVAGYVRFLPGTSLIGPIAIYSKDSISVPPKVRLINCILSSPKSIDLQKGASVTAQLFSPVIRCSTNATANYPSLLVSVSLSDTGGVVQSINLESGSKIDGALILHGGVGITKDKAVVNVESGSLVTGEVYTDCYLTLDGKVNGLARAFDLYFYSSPTTYLGWLRNGVIDRELLPRGFLRPLGISAYENGAVIRWM
jgi:hypothetical protein